MKKKLQLKFSNYFFNIHSNIKILGNYKYGKIDDNYKKNKNLHTIFNINILNKNLSYNLFKRYYYSYFIRQNSKKIIEEKKILNFYLNFSVANIFEKNVDIYATNFYNYFSFLRFSKKKTLAEYLNDITFLNLLRRSVLTFHGACFSVKKKSFIITAPPDTGKSETVLNILKQTKSSFISEDVLLIKKTHAISLPYTQTLTKRRLSFLTKLFSNIHNFFFKSNFLKKTLFELNDYKNTKIQKNPLKVDTIFYLKPNNIRDKTYFKEINNKEKIINDLIKINHLEFHYFKNELILSYISSHDREKDITYWLNLEKKLTSDFINKINVVEINCGKNKKYSDEIINYLNVKKLI